MDGNTRAELHRTTKPLVDSEDWHAIECLWKPFVDVGDIDAIGDLAYLYESNGFDGGPDKDEQIRAMLEQAAANDHSDALYWLGGLGPRNEYRDGLLQRAAALGNPNAQYSLGACYATGNWTGPKDPALGVYWYTRAAEQGVREAQYNLGFMYILGQGTAPDVSRGLSWLKIAAAQGDSHAMRLLRDLYRNGYYGVAQNAVAANEWERKFREAEPASNL